MDTIQVNLFKGIEDTINKLNTKDDIQVFEADIRALKENRKVQEKQNCLKHQTDFLLLTNILEELGLYPYSVYLKDAEEVLYTFNDFFIAALKLKDK